MNRRDIIQRGISNNQAAVRSAVEPLLPTMPSITQEEIYLNLRNNPIERRNYLTGLANRHGDNRPIEEIDKTYLQSQGEKYG